MILKILPNFLAYNRQHAEDMKNWSPEQLAQYCNKVNELRENNPEVKEQYDKWSKMLELKQKCHITIGGTAEETASSRACLTLKKLQEKEKNKKTNSEVGQKQPDIAILKKKKKQYTI